MAIVNRDCDTSQQKDVIEGGFGALATGVTRMIQIMPYPCTLQTVKHACAGVSGAPIVTLFKIRGITSEAIGISGIVLQTVGTSGSLAFSGLAAAGSTLLSLNAGDVLGFSTSGSNAAVTDLVLEMAVLKIQDIVSYN